MKIRNPAKAGFLNIIFPGLGCAYIGKWIYALAYLIWVPLAWVSCAALAGILVTPIADQNLKLVVFGLILFGFRIRILWDVFYTPYSLTEENNRKLAGILRLQANV